MERFKNWLIVHCAESFKAITGLMMFGTVLLLQISGILLLIIGWAFIAQYPPLNALMVIYPTWGIGMVVAGRHMGKRTREKIKDNK